MADEYNKPKPQPCAECPFARAVKPGTTGGSDVTRFVGQAIGPFVLNCHMDPIYSDKPGVRLEERQCCGAAMFRDLIGVAELMPEAFHHLKGDPALVFSSPAELIAHHRGITVAEAEAELRETPPTQLLEIELSKLKPGMVHRVPRKP